MKRFEREVTAPIMREQLLRLLDTMTPPPQQAITARTLTADIEAELARIDANGEPAPPAKAQPATAQPAKPQLAAGTEAGPPRFFSGVDWDEFLTDAVSKMVTPRTPRAMPPPVPRSRNHSSRPKRKSAQPFSQVAALLPPCQPIRFPRASRPPPSKRAKTQNPSLAVAEHKGPRTVAELRARLDRGETAAQWAASCELSPQVLAHLTVEEIAMLPAEFRGSPPRDSDGDPPPRIEMTPEPSAEIVGLQLAARAAAANAKPQRKRVAAISLVSLFLVGICAVYFLV